ncbi:MAG: DUF6108 family protein [Bacteroidales bacterium]|nr:DUF6108 family protein [Bacteroidales bacterium]
MKRLLICIMALLLFSGAAFAQRGLNCYPVFRGKIVPAKRMIVTEARGESMATYKLDYYHSVQFQVDEETAKKVAELIRADATDAQSAQTEMTGEFLTYALIQPTPFARVRRYLCYQARPVGAAWIITILYLEGSATLDDLRSMFEKQ